MGSLACRRDRAPRAALGHLVAFALEILSPYS